MPIRYGNPENRSSGDHAERSGMSYLKLCVDEPRAPRAVGQRQQQHEKLNMWLTLPLPRTSACHPRSSCGHPNRISFLERARSAPNNLRYNSLRSAQHPTGYHRVYVIYSAIMYRGTSFIFPAHRVRPSTGNNDRPRLTPEADCTDCIDRTDHTNRKRHRAWTPFVVLWAVMSTILVLLTVSTHPSDSVYTLQYQGGTFLVDRSQYQQLADAFLHGRTWIDAHVPRLACGHG